MSSIFISHLQTIKPKNAFTQSEIIAWSTRAHQRAESFQNTTQPTDAALIEKLFHRYAVKEAQISKRYFECNDILAGFSNEADVYKIEALSPHGIDIKGRADFYSSRALQIFKSFYDVSTVQNRPDHLIHVTCTGYASPSAAQRIVTEANWGQNTDITHAYHMGCYAALPAIRLARSIAASENQSVDIVHNEMCGLHMNTLAQTPEQIVVQTLFADGHAKYTVSGEQNQAGANLKILAISEKVIADSENDMSWIPAPWGMQMNLSRHVPAKIKAELRKFSLDLFEKAKLPVDQALKSIFAIHPGGPKIIDSVQETLELSSEQIRESRKVLFERGNMSSATLPHVWEEIVNGQYPKGTKVVSFAFGPGLTIFGSVFEVC